MTWARLHGYVACMDDYAAVNPIKIKISQIKFKKKTEKHAHGGDPAQKQDTQQLMWVLQRRDLCAGWGVKAESPSLHLLLNIPPFVESF